MGSEMCIRDRFTEYGAGAAELTKAMLQHGITCCSFDRSYSAEHDMSTPSGLRRWILHMCCTSPQSLQWFAPQCSAWDMMSRSQTAGSAARMLGDDTNPRVRAGSGDVMRITILAALASTLKNKIIIEQPLTSVMPHVPFFSNMLRVAGASQTTIYLGSWGAKSQEPRRLKNTTSIVLKLRTTKPSRSDHGLRKRKHTGGRHLAARTAYPRASAVRIAALSATKCGNMLE